MWKFLRGLFLLEGEADALFDRESWVDFGEGGGGFFQGEAEGDEGVEGFVGGASGSGEGELGVGGAVVAGEADFVAEVDDDAFGGLFADAGGLGDEGGVGVGDGVTDIFGRAEAEDADGGFRADAVDGNQHFEELFGSKAGETVEVFGVFAEGVVGVELDFVAEVGAFGVRGGEDEFVADAVDVDDDGSGEFFGDGAEEVGDH